MAGKKSDQSRQYDRDVFNAMHGLAREVKNGKPGPKQKPKQQNGGKK